VCAEPGEPIGVTCGISGVRLGRVQSLTRWNDEPGRRCEDVVAVLDRAIAAPIQELVSLPSGDVDRQSGCGGCEIPAEEFARSRFGTGRVGAGQQVGEDESCAAGPRGVPGRSR
jgi:hypothetical protein